MKKAGCMSAMILLAASVACADMPVASIRWIDRDYDFGLMKEQAGPKTGHSRFVNLGPDTISIFSVKPSCGCTSAEFSDAPIAPGDTALIAYTYDPEMRPGKFDKSVKVRLSNGDRYSIRITGNVLGTPESLATLYPVDAGEMRLTDAVINAGDITDTESQVFFFNAYSLPLDTIYPSVKSPSAGLVINPSKPKAGPGDLITYSLNFLPRRHSQYGPVEIPVEFTADPAGGSEPVTVTFRAFVLPDTERLSLRQQGKNPICEPAPDPIDLGMSVSGPVKTEFTIRNAGKAPLDILRIFSTSEAVRFDKIPDRIKPGKTARIKVEFDPALLPSGPFRIPLGIITTDPLHPHLELPLAGIKP
jgi:hypothetical protein